MAARHGPQMTVRGGGCRGRNLDHGGGGGGGGVGTEGEPELRMLHCPKFLKLSRDKLRSVDATKLHTYRGSAWVFFRITLQTVLLFLNELQNMLRNSLWFCSDIRVPP